MITRSGGTAQGTLLGLKPVHVAANPTLRGPIVLATDGTSETGATVLAAQLLAARLDRPIEVVTVLEPLPTFRPSVDFVVPIDPATDETRRDARETSVRDYVARFAGGAAPPHIEVRTGNVATEIARFARERSATIVVMGSAPHRQYRHIVSGERVAQVLHSAQCPVLSVPPSFTSLPRTVVVAMDFGPSSARAAKAAMLLVADGGTVCLTHVIPRPIPVRGLNIVPARDLAVELHALFDIVREEMASSVPDGVTMDTRLVADDTVEGILATAERMGAELIAVGTHGGRFARLFLGGVADAVLRSAEQAVLSAPPPRIEVTRAVVRDDDPQPPEEESEWAAALDAFSRRNAGRVASLELHDPTIGNQITGHGYAFLGATYEPVAHRVEVMVGDADSAARHLTRSVLYPAAITITPAPTGEGEILEIRHGSARTVVTVTAP